MLFTNPLYHIVDIIKEVLEMAKALGIILYGIAFFIVICLFH
nr:MAG TPA: hypothetical protein [Bacteriophage sp.]